MKTSTDADQRFRRLTEAFPAVRDFSLLSVFDRVWRTGDAEHYIFARPMPARDVASWLLSRGQCVNCGTRHDCPDGHFVDILKRLNN